MAPYSTRDRTGARLNKLLLHGAESMERGRLTGCKITIRSMQPDQGPNPPPRSCGSLTLAGALCQVLLHRVCGALRCCCSCVAVAVVATVTKYAPFFYVCMCLFVCLLDLYHARQMIVAVFLRFCLVLFVSVCVSVV